MSEPDYAANAKLHPVPWECPEHDEAMLFGSKTHGLRCGICQEIAIRDARIAALEAEVERMREALTDICAHDLAAIRGAGLLVAIEMQKRARAALGGKP